MGTESIRTAHALTDLYEVLQVSPHASPEVIHAAYRALARACHPDVNPSIAASRRMSELNSAFDVLSDTQRRAQYDLQQLRVNRKPIAADRSTRPTMVLQAQSTRGSRPARSPHRVEDERMPLAHGRALLLLALLVVFAVFLAMLIWVISLLDESPTADMLASSSTQFMALNLFLTTPEQATTVPVAESVHDVNAV